MIETLEHLTKKGLQNENASLVNFLYKNLLGHAKVVLNQYCFILGALFVFVFLMHFYCTQDIAASAINER